MKLALGLALCGVAAAAVPPANFPDWAHRHWVWLSNERSNQSAVLRMLDQFISRDIPVGAVNVDSGWATGYNSFEFRSDNFPDAKAMIDTIHGKGARVTLWATSMVDTDSPNYQEASTKGFFIKNLFGESTPLKWWHGRGGLVDYSNPEALAWWHGQLDKVLDLNIDGFKTDGTDPFMLLYFIPRASSGVISYRDYADWYYGDFFNYTRARLGPDRLIMARPVDGVPVLSKTADLHLSFAPRYAVLSGWVGDQDATFEGLQTALRSMFHSAWRGYPGFGCDIAGYRSGKRDVELYTRWFQLGAFLPLMENGGNNAHFPWDYEAQDGGASRVTDRYRRFVTAHEELLPYTLQLVAHALEAGGSALRPLNPPPRFDLLLQLRSLVKTFAFTLGEHLFVQPITRGGMQPETVAFPGAPGSAPWVEFFNHMAAHEAGATETHTFSLDDFPVYLRAGAVVPMLPTSTLLHVGVPGYPAMPRLATRSTPLFAVVPRPQASGSAEVRESFRAGTRIGYTLSEDPETHAQRIDLQLEPYEARPVVVFLSAIPLEPRAGESVASAAARAKVLVAYGAAGATAAAVQAEDAAEDATLPPVFTRWLEEQPGQADTAAILRGEPSICASGSEFALHRGAPMVKRQVTGLFLNMWILVGCVGDAGATVKVLGL